MKQVPARWQFLYWGVLIGLLGCGNKETTQPQPVRPAKGVVDAAPSTKSPPNTKADAQTAKMADAQADSLKHHMKDHFAAVKKIQQTLVAGQLGEARKQADWLAKHRAHDALKAWEPHLQRVRGAARKLAETTTLPQAASIAADLGYQCGSCHLTMTAITTFEWIPAPTKTDTFAAKMQFHQWAADRLWEGLVGPSDSLWKEGAKALASPLPVDELLSVTAKSGIQLKPAQRDEIRLLAKQVHELGKKAMKTQEREIRGRLYGELLTTCSGCHKLARKPK